MNFIVFDLEFNQDFSSQQNTDLQISRYPFEIIQIGALKLDSELNTVATFNRYVKPSIYKKISPFITELTGITTEQLQTEESFTEVYNSFLKFIESTDSIFCIWGMSDIKELFKNAEYHKLNTKLLPRMFINLQPYVSKHLSLSSKTLLRLQQAVEALNLPLTYPFHNALHDAYYTAEILKKVYNTSMEPRLYDPAFIPIRPRKPKRVIDTEKLIQQFEKMYSREISDEEKGIILLAYKMGKTGQFLK